MCRRAPARARCLAVGTRPESLAPRSPTGMSRRWRNGHRKIGAARPIERPIQTVARIPMRVARPPASSPVRSVAFVDGGHALSGSGDGTVRYWEVATGRAVGVFEGHTAYVMSVAFSADGRHGFSAAMNGVLQVWELPERTPREPVAGAATSTAPDHGPAGTPEQLLYTNAKVLLVGDSGVGKTSLSIRLAENTWRASGSTVGAWATRWSLGVAATDGVEREIWLWDFGGQADQRLIHQLFMEETRLAVLVFDPQKDELFEGLGRWDHDLARVAREIANGSKAVREIVFTGERFDVMSVRRWRDRALGPAGGSR